MSRNLNLEEITDFLRANPGYIKWGNKKLAKKLVVGVLDVETAKNRLKGSHIVVNAIIETKEKIVNNDVGFHVSIGCMHVPFHNVKLFTAFKKFLKELNPVGFHIVGDFLDLNSLSSHDRGKLGIKGITLDFEYKEGNRVLNEIQSCLSDKCRKSYVYGNHEDRYFRYMKDVDNAKIGSAISSPTEALSLSQRGYSINEDWKNGSIGLGPHLDLVHGEFINQHCAKKHIDTYRKSIVFYHSHRIQAYLEGQTAGYNGGAMANFNSEAFGYATKAMKSSWNNGFNVIYLDENGIFNVQQIIWYNNKFTFGGKVYEA